jgi:hypothetical protein
MSGSELKGGAREVAPGAILGGSEEQAGQRPEYMAIAGPGQSKLC